MCRELSRFPAQKRAAFPTHHVNYARFRPAKPAAAPDRPYICGYDDERPDISVTSFRAHFAVPGEVFDTLVARQEIIYHIVGNALPCQAAARENTAKQAGK
jgi:hypothetical protein